MIYSHPDDNFLAEYASGSLDWGLSILVSAHLEYCPACKQKIKTYEQLSASLLPQTACAVMADQLLNDELLHKVLDKIDKLPPKTAEVEPASTYSGKTVEASNTDYPQVLQRFLRSKPLQPWRNLTQDLRSAQIITGQNRFDIRVLNIRAGGKVATHDHGGLEVTLVLKGSFSDQDGLYLPGDFVVKVPGQPHSAVAAQNENCLCILAQKAPIIMGGLLGRFVNPFLRVQPM